MNDKVIEFPKHKVVRDVPGEIIEERNRRAELKQADAIVDEVTNIIITELDNYCVEVTDKSFAKDFILVIDALKACVYRQFGFDHHLHEFIEKNVSLIEADMESLTKEEIQAKIDEVMEGLIKSKEKLDELPEE
jgi:hypothetical protein